MSALTVIPDVWLPDGSVLHGADALAVTHPDLGDVLGGHQPRFWTAPPRHRGKADGCRACADPGYATGCGDYTSADMLGWARNFGYDLDAWQDWWLGELCGTKPDGRWSSFENYLVMSRQNGKNTCLEVRELAGLFLFSEKMIIHTAHEFKAAAEHFRRVRDVVTEYDELRRRVRAVTTSHGDEAIELKPKSTLIFGSGGKKIRRNVAGRLRFLARSRGSGRAFTADLVVYDEAMILSDEVVGASLPTLSAVPNPQVIYTASAGYKDSVQLAAVRRRVLARDPKLMGAEWSINPHLDTCPRDEIRGRKTNRHVVCALHDDRDDPRSWAKANPALGVRISVDHVAHELAAMTIGSTFDRERLGVGDWPAGDEAWAVISEDTWASCAVPDPGGATRPVTFAVDIDPDMLSACISACWYRPDETGKNRPVTEIPRGCHRDGVKWIMPELLRLRRAWKPVAVIVPKNGPAASLIPDLEKASIEVTAASSADEAAAFALMVTTTRHPDPDQRLIHLGRELAPGLWSSVASAETRDVGDGGRAWSRRDSAADITPITSATLALWGLNRKRYNYDPLKSIG